jgi:iron complex outermembrane receptor protein
VSNTHFTNVSSGWSKNPITGDYQQGKGRLAPAYDPAAIALGATPLEPEKSRDLSFGLVFQVSPQTNVTIDAYQIDIDNRIVQSSNLDRARPEVRAILEGAGLDPDQTISYFYNAGDTRTRGVDLVFDHLQRLGEHGTIKWVLTNSYIEHELKKLNNPDILTANNIELIGRDTQSKLTEQRPKNTTTLSGLWKVGGWDFLLKATHYTSSVLRNAVSEGRDEHIPASTVWDTALGYSFNQQVRLSVGANNVFDKRPPQLTDEAVQFYSFPVDRPNYSWAAPYGVNGAYYFARLDVAW